MKFPFFLRPDQLEALSSLKENDHLIHIAATGSGKSLIFQKYISDHPGMRAVLISPLNALSRQQSERFLSLGIRTFQEENPIYDESGVWILSPERLQGRVMDQLRSWCPQFLIVDEAHCVWEWGQGFRPAYRRVLDLVKIPSIEKSLWCSATLPPHFQRELKDHLKSMDHARVKKLGKFTLPSALMLRVEKIPPEIRINWLRNTLGLYANQSGMVFCNTRNAAVFLQKYLSQWGVRSFFYHAGLSVEEKINLEKRLKEYAQTQEPIVVVATSAFGMGMDYSFFQFCILFEPPFTILSLVQAIGRIGRNKSGVNTPARAHVLWHPSDFIRNKTGVDQREVQEWCQSLENPRISLENYFNGTSFSGTMKRDEYCDDSNRTTDID